MKYNFSEIEKKWQKFWEENKTFSAKIDSSKPKYYCLDFFPYPSSDGLHVGTIEGYTANDIMARYKRMKGYNVLHPIGWDAFGLPAEQYAIKTGIHPKITIQKSIENFTRQLKSIGLSYDWDREISTMDPDYYKWTQWIFVKLYKMGLAYQAEVPVNWCPELGTVLANEEVPEQLEKGYTVERKPLKQWMLKITAYAERLLNDLDSLDWPESTKEMQRNWIGKSEGAMVKFNLTLPLSPSLPKGEGVIEIFTTRPDTLWGATYMVMAPEHSYVDIITTEEQRTEVEKYKQSIKSKSDLERLQLEKEKTGVFTGAYAVNLVNNKEIPIWISDYVLMGYGTGAIMAVPGHDQRDWEFAKKFNLPIVEVVKGGDVSKEAFIEEGVAVNSDFINGLNTPDAIKKVTEWLEKNNLGKAAVQYKLRDWLFSRQRYWGEPIPVIHLDDGTVKVVDENDLPVTLPDVESYKPAGTGESPLAAMPEWVNTIDKETGRPARRETNTMPQWAGSCWYYLRFLDPHNEKELCGKEFDKYWMPVDLYIGGAEHAVLHLLYARFWHKVLYDLGYVSTPEPFKKLYHQGMVLANTYVINVDYENKQFLSWALPDKLDNSMDFKGYAIRGFIVPVEYVDNSGNFDLSKIENFKKEFSQFKNFEFVKSIQNGKEILALGSGIDKMSKSFKNVVNPDDVVSSYGADSLRLFEMFMGPLSAVKPWSTQGIEGVFRFLNRVWRLFINENGDLNPAIQDVRPERDSEILINKTIKAVTDDIEDMDMKFNTCVSELMIFINEISAQDMLPKSVMERFVLLLSPFAPHMAEELWQKLGHTGTIAFENWPVYDASILSKEKVLIVGQVNGKVRTRLEVERDFDEEKLKKMVREDEKVKKYVDGKEIVKEIVVKNKLVNIVVK